MKRRLIRVATAVVLAAAVATTTALPATAKPARPAVDPGTVVAVVKGIYDIYQQFIKGGGLTLSQAVQQIEAKITQAQTAIINEIDLIAAANVRACAESTVINFADIGALSHDNLQVFAFNATDCVTQANSLLTAGLGTKAAIDQIGFAMNTAGPLALMARIAANLTTPGLKSVLAAGDTTLITALLPTCTRRNEGDPDHPFYMWECIAYNGDEGDVPVTVSGAKTEAQDAATANTSRGIAQAALPTLAL